VSEEHPPELPRRKTRLPFEQRPFGGAVRSSALIVYGLLTLGLIGFALYMALVDRQPITSPFVAGPGIGALWFGLRLFMIWGSRT
jgi:hypothetical protein